MPSAGMVSRLHLTTQEGANERQTMSRWPHARFFSRI